MITITPYADVAYADEYNAVLGRPDWAVLSPDEKQQALAAATLHIDALRYTGGQPSGQPRKFPRSVNSGAVPEAVVWACCEEAYTIKCDKAAQQRAGRIRDGVTSESIGHVAKSYGNAELGRKDADVLISDAAAAYLDPWLLKSGVIT